MSGSERTAIIVQARMTSTRLPDKVLMELAGRSVLWHVLKRCQAIPGADVVCCAIPEGKGQEPVPDEAQSAGAVVFRGSESDVLGRYQAAARHLGATTVMRVTSDCPMIDPELCGQVLRLRREAGADYACNNMPRSWPHGLDCEAFTAVALARAAAEAREPYDREHVTPWLRRERSLRQINLPGPGGAIADERWTLDYPEDFAFLAALFELLPPPPAMPSMNEALEQLRLHPEIASINAAYRLANHSQNDAR
jgi:spore coat polysaccharide biosynthesis protein SpsF (cytidylyltransferase family)